MLNELAADSPLFYSTLLKTHEMSKAGGSRSMLGWLRNEVVELKVEEFCGELEEGWNEELYEEVDEKELKGELGCWDLDRSLGSDIIKLDMNYNLPRFYSII